MACNSLAHAALSLIALLFAVSNPLAVHGQISPPPSVGIPPVGIPPQLDFALIMLIVRGQLCCTANGNCPGKGVIGVPVNLTCPNIMGGASGTVTVQSLTIVNGTFALTVQIQSVLGLFSPRLCFVTSLLPALTTASSCPVLSTTNGSSGLGPLLRSGVRSAGTTNIPSITFGGSRVVNATTTGFIRSF